MHTFGSGPSPLLLSATVQEHLKQDKQEDSEFVSAVTRSLFIGDMACGGSTTEEVQTLKLKLIERFKHGHFAMRKWKLNVPELRDKVKSKHQINEGGTLE